VNSSDEPRSDVDSAADNEPPITTQSTHSDDPTAIDRHEPDAPLHTHTLTEIGQMTEEEWLQKVYQGHKMPQLTWRAILMGAVLGSLMSISNLYTSIKLGWAFGVAITACVLSFVIWNAFRTLIPKLPGMSILENNCMQSTASAAGYSTGSTVGTAFGALLLITGTHMDWRVLMAWTFATAGLGVFLAVPMKRQMVNQERLAFPSGIAAAETLRSLYGRSRSAILQAYSLVAALALGLIVGFLNQGQFEWQKKLKLQLPELLPVGNWGAGFPITLNGVNLFEMPKFGYEPSVLMIGAGMIIGPRVCISMLAGSSILYFIVGPYMVNLHEIAEPKGILKWALWTGTALMVTSGLTAFGLQWRTILRAFSGLKATGKSSTSTNPNGSNDPLDQVEVPMKWLLIGVVPLGLTMVLLQYFAFSIAIPLGILSVVMSFFLALVACRATGETDITPIGAMGKITQLAYACLAKSSTTTNLMTGSVTANIASSSADLLTDLKSGYLLGANARKQFIAQCIGVCFGTVAIVPAWYAMIPDKATFEHYNPPSALLWRAVAEALTHGINYIPVLAREGMVVGGLLGIVLALAEHYVPKQYKKFVPSSMGLGLSWVVWFSNSFGFFVGAAIAWIWGKINKPNAELFVVPVASGAIAGESIMAALLAMYNAALGLALKH
jgi:OPT family oligopeptide transporter